MNAPDADRMSAWRDEVAGVLGEHFLLYEPRAYPTYGCSCCEWDGAEGDDGGECDGSNDTFHAFLAHLAQALTPLFAAEREAGRAEGLRKAATALERRAGDFKGLAGDKHTRRAHNDIARWLRARAALRDLP